jgi:hypothetical protein
MKKIRKMRAAQLFQVESLLFIHFKELTPNVLIIANHH